MTEYPRQVVDHFLIQAAVHAFSLAIANTEDLLDEDVDPVLSVRIDELVRSALKARYSVISATVDDAGQFEMYSNPSWAIPRDRVLQFSALLRYLESDDSEAIPGLGEQHGLINSTQVLGMAEAWALRQGLFRGGQPS